MNFDLIIRNEVQRYKVDSFYNKLVLDVGAHRGYFMEWALYKGARTVIGYEPIEDNYNAANTLLEGKGNFSLSNSAIVRADIDQTYYTSTPTDNTGGIPIGVEGKIKVDSSPLDSVLEVVQPDILKIDAEGSEWPILFTNQLWVNIPLIVGELHPRPNVNFGEPIPGVVNYSLDEFAELMAKNRFKLELTRTMTGHPLYTFKAWK